MRQSRWHFPVVCVGIVCLGTIVGGCVEEGQAYHEKRMMEAYRQMKEAGPGGKQDEWITSYESHRDALVGLGYLVRREYPLRVKPPETKQLLAAIIAAFPDNVHYRIETREWGADDDRIVVWDRPNMMAAWDAFIRDHNVPRPVPSP